MSNFKWWGMELSLDLYDCNPETIRSKEKIEEFTIHLCDLIGVKRFGDPVIVEFGDEPRVHGYSMVQLIQTSLVSAHFAEETNAVYLNVFSCKEFDHQVVEDYASEFFEAKEAQPIVNYRK